MSSTVLAVVASLVFLVRLVPQPVHLARRGVASGVSPMMAMNAVIADVGWLVYGLAVGLPVVWVVSLLALVPGVWTVVLLRHRVRRPDLAGAGLWLAFVLAAGPAGALATVLSAGVVVTYGPQVWKAVREDDLRGIAPATWRLAVLDATAWGAYGLVEGDPALVGYATVLLSCAAVVLARLWWTRRLVLEPAVA